jgi:hypothetical protein
MSRGRRASRLGQKEFQNHHASINAVQPRLLYLERFSRYISEKKVQNSFLPNKIIATSSSDDHVDEFRRVADRMTKTRLFGITSAVGAGEVIKMRCCTAHR